MLELPLEALPAHQRVQLLPESCHCCPAPSWPFVPFAPLLTSVHPVRAASMLSLLLVEPSGPQECSVSTR